MTSIRRLYLLIVCLGLLFGSCAKPLPNFGVLPTFHLKQQDGQGLGLGDLRGSLWVADFIYTGCGSTCPMLTQKMRDLQDRLEQMKTGAAKVKLVSISVDPENDTTEKLKEYAERFGANPQEWAFLTGDTQEIQRVVTEGFKLAYGKEEEIFHSNKFVLVDGKGQIRGYYDVDDGGFERLVGDLKQLLREEKKS